MFCLFAVTDYRVNGTTDGDDQKQKYAIEIMVLEPTVEHALSPWSGAFRKRH